ncbi:MAG: dihydropteroate synthase [Canibacter sp.]
MTLLMGIVNVTPDSFSDGGDHSRIETAIAHGEQLIADGAHILDIGGESTRPGSERISAEVEQERMIEVVRALAPKTVVSVDTIHASTAKAGIAAGARIINDVSGGLYDPDMFDVVAASTAEIIICHWRGIPDPAHARSHYDDVVVEVREQLTDLAERAVAAGIPRDRIILDPGLGFDKTGPQCWEILNRLSELDTLGYRVLIGASRKRMLKDVLDGIPGAPNKPKDRDLGTSVVTALCAAHGLWGVRVHDIAGSAQAVAVHEAWQLGIHSSAEPVTAPNGNIEPATRVPSDMIQLTGLEAFAHHGVFEHEKRDGQTFFIDATAELDLRVSGASDNLSETVHYGELAEALVRAAEDKPVDLIETLAERLAATALTFAGIQQITITVHKPHAPITVPFGDVSVTITRGQHAGFTA